MKILLFGAGGLLGRHLAVELAAHGHQLCAFTRPEADITNRARLDEIFGESWDAVINAAAVCDFAACEKHREATNRINRDAPLDLAARCAERGAVFVQFSSDYVFRGDRNQCWTENDPAQPLSVYGEQKAALERDIPGLCPRSLILRLSWLYGTGGRTFMSLLPSLLAQQELLRVASGKTGRCLYAPDAAVWTRRLVECGDTGLFNLVNAGDTSWEEFAHTCREQMAAAGTNPRCRLVEEIPFGELGPDWPKRPRYSCLDTAKLAEAHPPGPRPWKEALDAFLREDKSFAASAPL
ncbi:MAG: SDR family oxidoreductase [Chthoniobacterales bacterium]